MKLVISLLVSGMYFLSSIFHESDSLKESIKRGKEVYVENCASCHLGTGEGVVGTFPPLAKADYLLKNTQNGIKAVKFGLSGKISVNGEEFDSMMPNPGLDTDEIADVMNYIMNTWGNDSNGEIVTAEMVEKIALK